MQHSIRSKCHKQISKQSNYGCELPLGLFSFLLLHSKTLSTEELTALAAFLLQGPGVTWLCSENGSSRRVPALILLPCSTEHKGSGSSHRDMTGHGLTQDQVLPHPKSHCLFARLNQTVNCSMFSYSHVFLQ